MTRDLAFGTIHDHLPSEWSSDVFIVDYVQDTAPLLVATPNIESSVLRISVGPFY